jgi:histidinol-phosphatase (PHP family)
MIESARGVALDELGISDHFALAPDGLQCSYALKHDQLRDYVSQIREAAGSPEGPVIRLGLEVDYFPETIETVRHHLAPYPFDFLICSVHFVNGFPVDVDSKPWRELSADSRNGIWRGYWHNLRAAVQTKMFDFVAHFDLPKKFGLFPSVDLTGEALSVLDAMAEAGMAVEINTSGWDKPVQEAYPALYYLKEANRRKIPLVINADAHRADGLVRHFDRARTLAKEAGYTEVVAYRARRRFAHPLF